MPWCHKCKQEYAEKIAQCPECGAKLTGMPYDTAHDEELIKEHLAERLLFTVENEVQFALITDALKKENIPFTSSAQEYWDHMQVIYTRTAVGEEVYVSADDYDKAKEIYDYFKEIKESNSDEVDDQDY